MVKNIYQEANCCNLPDSSLINTKCLDTVPSFNFGFPKCYPTIPSSKETYKSQENLNEFGAKYMLPVLGRSSLQPYNTFSVTDCKGSEKHLAVTLPPHFSPIGTVVYHTTTRLGALPSKFNRNVMVSGVGSWHTAIGIDAHQRNGQTVMSFKMGLTHKVEALEQEMLVPNLNEKSLPWMPDGGISPAGLHQSESGALLFTSKRGNRGLFAITDASIPSNINATWNGMSTHKIEDVSSGELRRISSKVVDGTEYIITTNRNKEIRARVLNEDYSVGESFLLAMAEHELDGLTVHGDTLYYGSSSDVVVGSGVYMVNNLGQHLKTKAQATGTLFERDHIYLRPRHRYNSIEITPDGKYMIILSGNAPNWGPDSTGFIIAKDMSTGKVYEMASGVRNPTGISFDGTMAYITQMGSDVGQNTWSNEMTDLGAYAPGDSVLSVDLSKWNPEIVAPKNTDIDDREKLLAWINSSCEKVLETKKCEDPLELSKMLPTDASDTYVHIICPKSCKSYIESL